MENVKEIYKQVTERFPSSGVSAYIRRCLEQGKVPEPAIVIHELMNITYGISSDLVYIDQFSKTAARDFAQRLRSREEQGTGIEDGKKRPGKK